MELRKQTSKFMNQTTLTSLSYGRVFCLESKIKNFTRTKFYLFSVLYTPTKFQASRFNNIKKNSKVGRSL